LPLDFTSGEAPSVPIFWGDAATEPISAFAVRCVRLPVKSRSTANVAKKDLIWDLIITKLLVMVVETAAEGCVLARLCAIGTPNGTHQLGKTHLIFVLTFEGVVCGQKH
jgi:hypothetical protein